MVVCHKGCVLSMKITLFLLWIHTQFTFEKPLQLRQKQTDLFNDRKTKYMYIIMNKGV